MNPLTIFRRPEYLFRPSQVLRRLSRFGRDVPAEANIRLPWYATVRVRTRENVGSDIYHYGVFDPIVPEAIWRLLDKGETAIDVGANIGQNTSVMAYRAGKTGFVLAFEAHPEIFAELQQNRKSWNDENLAMMRFESVALGAERGSASIVDGMDFATNRGSATVEVDCVLSDRRKFPVQVETLNAYTADLRSVGVCKLDVEGKEFAVIQGATNLLTRKIVRDLIFEDFDPMPSKTARFLESFGFVIFQLKSRWMKPVLVSTADMEDDASKFSYNYLATLAPARAIARFRPFGWRCLMNL